MTSDQIKARDEAALKILRDSDLTDEQGTQMTDFALRNRDALDFTSMSRTKLRRMLHAAYEAGLKGSK